MDDAAAAAGGGAFANLASLTAVLFSNEASDIHHTHGAVIKSMWTMHFVCAHIRWNDADDDVQLAGSRPLAHLELLIFQKGVRAQISIIYVKDLMSLKWEF